MSEILQAVGGALLWGLSLIAAWAVARRLDDHTERPLASLLSAYVIFYFFQVLSVKLLAYLGALTSAPLLALYGLVALVGLTLTAQSRGTLTFPRPVSDDSPLSMSALRLTLASAGVVMVGLAVFTLLVPTHVWDVQAYHMPMVAGYVQTESLSIGPTQDLRQVFRVNAAELQMLNVALLSGSDAWMELPNVVALGVSLVAVFAIARSVLNDRSAALLTVIAALTAPQILYGSVTAKNDIVFLALILSAFYWTIQIARASEPDVWVPLVLAAAASSLAVATKVMGINVLGTVGLALLVMVLLRRARLRHVIVFTLVALFGIAILVGDVYWSNFNRTQMPVGIRPDEVQFTFGLANVIEAAKFYLYDLSFRRLVTTQIYEHDFSHYGYLFPFLLILGSYVAIRQLFKPKRRLGVSMLAALSVVLFLSVIAVRLPIQWDQRFMIWMVPAFGILAAYTVRRWSEAKLLAAIAFCSALSLLNVVQIYTEASGGILQKSVTHLVQEGRLASLADVAHEKYGYKIDGFDVLSSTAAPQDSILYVGAEDTWMYPAWGRRFSRTVVGVRDSLDLDRKLASGAYEFVLVEADAAESLQSAVSTSEARDNYSILYQSDNRSIFRRQQLSGSAPQP